MATQFSVRDGRSWRPLLDDLGGSGAVDLGLAPSSATLLAVGGALPMGIMTPIVNGPSFAVVQSTVQSDVQPRVFSLLTSVGSGMAPAKEMIVFERSAHRPPFEEPGSFASVMSRILEETYGGGR